MHNLDYLQLLVPKRYFYKEIRERDRKKASCSADQNTNRAKSDFCVCIGVCVFAQVQIKGIVLQRLTFDLG